MFRYSDAVLDSDPNGYWRLNDYSGHLSTVTDSVLLNDGAYYGAAGIVTEGAVLVDSGKFDGALYCYNQTPTYAQIPYAANLNSSNFSLEFWFKVASAPTDKQYLISSSTGTAGYEVYLQSGNITVAVFPDATLNSIAINTDWLNEFIYVIVTHNHTTKVLTMSLYVNSEQVASHSITYTGIFTANTTSTLRFGADTIGSANQFFTGTIDEVAFYPTVLTQASIDLHMDSGLAQTIDSQEDWLESTVNSIEQYILDEMDIRLSNPFVVRMSFPSKNEDFNLPLPNTIIALEIDDISNNSMGFGDQVWGRTYDDDAGTFTEDEAGWHELDFGVSIWASADSGGSTARMRAYQLLTDIFYGSRAYNKVLSQRGIEILSFAGGLFTREVIEEQDMFHVGGIDLKVRVFSKNTTRPEDAITFIDEIDQDPDLDLS